MVRVGRMRLHCTLWFPPPAPPWSTNQDRNLNPYDRAERIRLWKETVQMYWRWEGNSNPIGPSGIQGAWPEEPTPMLVELTIPFTKNRRRDPHNYCGTVLKAVIDGLVIASGIPDDTPEWVGHREPKLVKGDTVYLHLTPLESEKA